MGTIGERIKLARERLGMSQDELAVKVGYNNRSSVNRIEKCRDLPATRLILFADALQVTPSFLLGYTE